MDLDFWKKLASLWSKRENADEIHLACEKGRDFGKILNAKTVVYRDDDFFDYDEDDDEDEI